MGLSDRQEELLTRAMRAGTVVENEALRKLVLDLCWEHQNHTGALPHPESDRTPELAALLRSVMEADPEMAEEMP